MGEWSTVVLMPQVLALPIQAHKNQEELDNKPHRALIARFSECCRFIINEQMIMTYCHEHKRGVHMIPTHTHFTTFTMHENLVVCSKPNNRHNQPMAL